MTSADVRPDDAADRRAGAALAPGGVPLLALPEPGGMAAADWSGLGLPGTVTETGYAPPEGLGLDEWLEIGRGLQRLERSVQWWLGDWWRYGRRRYGDMAARAARAAIKDATGYSYETARQAGRVAARFGSGERSPDLSWSHHLAVAALPPEAAAPLLAEAAGAGLSVRDTQERARALKRRPERRVHPEARSGPSDPRGTVAVADARRLPLRDGTVDLIVTSPPYGLEIGYEGGDVPAADWAAFMAAWLREALRVTKPSGRLALNVPLDTSRGGSRPTFLLAGHAALAAGWAYQATITWHEGNTTTGNRGLGSVDSAARPHPVDSSEMIALFSKGAWGPSSDNPDDITPEQWQQAGRGPWTFGGETRPWEGHPAAFPEELPRRLIRYLSRVGDLVLDPFCGSGTTPLVAAQLGRRAIGFDASAAYVASTRRRIAAWERRP